MSKPLVQLPPLSSKAISASLMMEPSSIGRSFYIATSIFIVNHCSRGIIAWESQGWKESSEIRLKVIDSGILIWLVGPIVQPRVFKPFAAWLMSLHLHSVSGMWFALSSEMLAALAKQGLDQSLCIWVCPCLFLYVYPFGFLKNEKNTWSFIGQCFLSAYHLLSMCYGSGNMWIIYIFPVHFPQ